MAVEVNVQPMPPSTRQLPAHLRPMPAPIFDGDPSPADIELARELYLALDDESQRWYAGFRIFADMQNSTTLR